MTKSLFLVTRRSIQSQKYQAGSYSCDLGFFVVGVCSDMLYVSICCQMCSCGGVFVSLLPDVSQRLLIIPS